MRECVGKAYVLFCHCKQVCCRCFSEFDRGVRGNKHDWEHGETDVTLGGVVVLWLLLI